MKKLAAFVEGQTEQIFVQKLLEEASGKKRIAIESQQAFGGQSGNRVFRIIQAAAIESKQQFYAQIVDCRSDTRVKSDVVENYAGLVASGFETIFAIRDVYPKFIPKDISNLRGGLRYGVKSKPVTVQFILGIMEIETWFISEHTHFQKLDTRLTPDFIKKQLGFDPSVDDIQLRSHPAEDLDNIYGLVGLSYKKNRSQVQHVVNLLDYERLYLELPSRIPDLKVLIDTIDQFLSE